MYSDECRKEIDIAIDKNKRVIPVMLGKPEELKKLEDKVHQGLTEINIIFFSYTDTDTDAYEIAKNNLSLI